MAKTGSRVQTRRAAQQKKPVAPTTTARRGPVAGIREIFGELKKVTWPTPEVAQRLTIVVLIISVLVGAFLGGADFILQFISRGLLGF